MKSLLPVFCDVWECFFFVQMKRMLFWLTGPLLFLLAFILLPEISGLNREQSAVCGVAFWMILWWISEIIPMGITALIPVVLFPLLKISDTADTIANFANPTLYLFLGGFMLAIGIEKTGLHERIALFIIRLFGKNTNGLIFGFFLATWFISMWVSNTATALMMLPMARSVIVLLKEGFESSSDTNDSRYFALLIMLGIAYSANIGGVATLIGTPPNIVMKGYISNLLHTDLSFGKWMLLGVPLSFGLLIISYYYLTRFRYPISMKEIPGSKLLIESKWDALGKMSRNERLAAGIFGLTASLWISAPSINSLFDTKLLDDTLIAIFGGSLMFTIPVNRHFNKMILSWEDARQLPWDILLLFGGGLSLAHGLRETQLMELIGDAFKQMHSSEWVLLAFLTLVMLLLTEVMSNIALASIFIPVVIGIAESYHYSSLNFAVSVGLASSFAFMLPISTPPNAIVYGSGNIPMREMIRSGLVLNLISVVWILLMVRLLGAYAL
ncbi:MAG: DASS family sodium-coupled anion symporter [Bacteroidetes bacterium]|nr:DASS family sodium-coupled anion symporter [Bacteroidota bacterium]